MTQGNAALRLEGKIALVTGAARGIGRGIADAFAREGAGVAVCDVDRATEAAGAIHDAFEAETMAVTVDVRDRDGVVAMADAVSQRFGRIDVLVNNAGVSKVAPFLDTDESLWDETIAVNLKGAFLCCQAVLPGMLELGRGAIINISSQSGKRGNAQYAAYCASKFGLIGLTQSLAQEYAAAGIRVNAICPGVVFTDLWQSPDMIERYAAKHGIAPTDVEDYFKAGIPLGRLGTPEDVARVAVFLASDESAYMTGQALNVTGGAMMG